MRVAEHLDQWFTQKAELKETLDNVINSLWEQLVIAPMLQLAQENTTEDN